MRFYQLTELIGRTPIVKFHDVFVKLEMYNPSGSIKDRPAKFIIQKLLETKQVKPGDTIIEATSGNMGIALAYYALIYKLHAIIVMPDHVSKERIQRIKALRGEVILTDHTKAMSGAIEKVQEILKEHDYYYIDQFHNINNVRSHQSTSQEIWEDLPNVDYVVAGIGTGGTIRGISKYLKEYNPQIKIVGVEPTESPVISKGQCGPSLIPGIGSDFIPPLLDHEPLDTIIDEMVTVSSEDAHTLWRSLNDQGLLVGVSSAAAIYASQTIKQNHPEAVVLTLAPDGIDRYLSDAA